MKDSDPVAKGVPRNEITSLTPKERLTDYPYTIYSARSNHPSELALLHGTYEAMTSSGFPLKVDRYATSPEPKVIIRTSENRIGSRKIEAALFDGLKDATQRELAKQHKADAGDLAAVFLGNLLSKPASYWQYQAFHKRWGVYSTITWDFAKQDFGPGKFTNFIGDSPKPHNGEPPLTRSFADDIDTEVADNLIKADKKRSASSRNTGTWLDTLRFIAESNLPAVEAELASRDEPFKRKLGRKLVDGMRTSTVALLLAALDEQTPIEALLSPRIELGWFTGDPLVRDEFYLSLNERFPISFPPEHSLPLALRAASKNPDAQNLRLVSLNARSATATRLWQLFTDNPRFPANLGNDRDWGGLREDHRTLEELQWIVGMDMGYAPTY